VILWLASYPRSGNTLLRIILRHCFDVWSYPAVSHAGGGSLRELVGNLTYSGERESFVRARRRLPGTHFVKTHLDVPEPDDRAIYIVRDGRAALASYRRFLHDIDKVDFTLAQLVVGWPLALTWSAHVARWIDLPNVLLLRYEELSHPAGPPLERIARFIDRPILKPFDVTFAQLHSVQPKFFGVGRDGPGIELVEREVGDAFWEANGAMMARLGYGPRAATSRGEG